MSDATDAEATLNPVVAVQAPSPSTHNNTEPATREPKPNDPYLLCDLCNAIVYDEAAHRQHQHADVEGLSAHTASSPSVQATPADAATALGEFVYQAVRVADQGAGMFASIQSAARQLRRLLSETLQEHPGVYLFGSCVSMGIWDGLGDADFTVIFPKLLQAQRAGIEAAKEADHDASDENEKGEIDDHAAAETHVDPCVEVEVTDAALEGTEVGDGAAHDGAPQPTAPSAPTVLSARKQREMESKAVTDIARKLRDAGFKFEELEVLPRTRVPLVKRRSESKRPYELRRLDETYQVNLFFPGFHLFTNFHPGNYGATEVKGATRKGSGKVSMTLEMADGADALRFFSRRETPGITKQWALHHRLPEIFSIDFDISCRPFGIRNSWFLREYLAQNAVFRAGNLFIKQWSKQRGVNYSRQGYLTSYAMSCLWIYYLLRAGEAVFVDPANTPFEPRREQEEISHMPLWPFEAGSPEHAAQLVRLGTLVRGFFRFYATEFDYDHEVVTLRRDVRDASLCLTRHERRWVETEGLDSVLLRDRCYYNFCIEDVYEELNLGRHLTPLKVAWVRSQFAKGLACCDTGLFSELTLNPFEEAEETLRAELYRHLMEKGPCTVEDLHAHLRTAGQSAGRHLAAYELRHRLSDLWRDESLVASDTATAVFHGRRFDNSMPPESLLTKGFWEATCTSDVAERQTDKNQVPRRVDEEAGFVHRVIQLVDPGKGPLARPAADALTRYAALKKDLTKPGADSVGIAVPLHDTLRHLFVHLFFSIDDGARLFNSFVAKTAFAEHLRLVAICLDGAQSTLGGNLQGRPTTIGANVAKPKSQSKRGHNGKPDAAALSAAVMAQIDLRKLGSAQEALIRYIVTCPTYVTSTPVGYRATPQLAEHGGRAGAEEGVQRSKQGYAKAHSNQRQPQHQRNAGRSRAAPTPVGESQ